MRAEGQEGREWKSGRDKGEGEVLLVEFGDLDLAEDDELGLEGDENLLEEVVEETLHVLGWGGVRRTNEEEEDVGMRMK